MLIFFIHDHKRRFKIRSSYDFKKRSNIVYKVSKDSIINVGKIDVKNFYKEKLNCENLTKKSLNYHPKHTIEVKIYNNTVNYSSNELSKESINVIDNELKKSRFYLDKENVYLIRLKVSQIEIYECLD
ncbi:hypothetical protein [uncultured Tenacibaculum sp.]|uniref:hypothetical protein n=1 Tax=uncultured Tenacibaculum sp. TaxID=174713 RepID=UPI0026132669|nr:hypothetical protein [uncultured Tenacibaculum sp.]